MSRTDQILASIDRNLNRIADTLEILHEAYIFESESNDRCKYAKDSSGDIINLEKNCCEGCDGWDTCAGKELHDGTVELKKEDLPTFDN